MIMSNNDYLNYYNSRNKDDDIINNITYKSHNSNDNVG